MSEPITAYTNTDAIRAAIGVTDNEITDAMLKDQNLALELEADLLNWYPDHAAVFAGGMSNSAAITDKENAAHIMLYAQWYCAAQVILQMTLGLLQLISDGKSEVRRFQQQNLEELGIRVSAKVAYYKGKIQEAQGVSLPTSATVMVRSIPDYDPITG